MNELDHLTLELSGRNLIEASAGTGKTYAIACLYLRLVIEQGLTPDRILVVTYTEAATEELRGRIRSRLREALELFSGGGSDDPILQRLVANENGKGPERGVGRERLNLALTSFDMAAIFTIHGFCLRALQDHAFESGSLYDTELVTDSSPLLQEIVDDFWRMKFFRSPAPLLGHALTSGLTPEYCNGFLTGMLGNPDLRILPCYGEGEVEALEEGVLAAFEAVAATWRDQREEITLLLTDKKNLRQAEGFYRPDLVPAYWEGMDAYLAGGAPYELFPDFQRFTTSGIAQGTMPKKGISPVHRFFVLCQELAHGVHERFLALRWELIAFVRRTLPVRKREANIRFFDDLLTDLYEALRRESGPCFAISLREKYPAALIDEFQDTDPIQYDIFRKIYQDGDSPLFLIGDPKQAIYSFRGADIFAYLEAAAEIEPGRRFTLTSNWRSSPLLLGAFNRIFVNEGRPFLFDRIAYHPLRVGADTRGSRLLLTEFDQAPLQFWFVPPGEGGGGMTVGDANREIPAAVAAEIGRLLQGGREGRALLEGEPLLPQDLAVIVRNHWQATAVQEALRALRIPSVMRSDRSIFATDEARELATLLAALAEPGNETRVRTALVTDLLGRSGDDIATLLESEQAWELTLQSFRDYHQSWLERGFMVMSQSLLSRERVRSRLLRRPDGERRLTNLLHCFEVIHRAAHEGRLGIQGQVTWFNERVSGGEEADEYQIRLETDEKAVRIVTVHVSKGLEYPVVFCPFLWGGIKGGGEVISFHDGFTLVKDFGSPGYDEHRPLALKESLAESLRLLYVALTRAKFRCYLVGGKFFDKNRRNRPESSPLSYLFHTSGESRAAADPVTLQEQEISALSASRMEEQLQALAAAGGGEIAVLTMPEPDDLLPLLPSQGDGEELRCRRFTGVIDQSWRVSSFTSFAAHESVAPELPDRDRLALGDLHSPPLPAGGEATGRSIFTFPRGARAGIFLHEIFEKLDFSAGITAQVTGSVAEGLKKHGFAPEWLEPLCTMIADLLAASLGSSGERFTLADLRPGSWLAEMEFFFPLRFITSELLRDCFHRWSGRFPALDLESLCGALKFRPVQGMVRGFMDLVYQQGGRYYLLDWKSNHLGNRPEEYGKEALATTMESNLYGLQYLLYTVALNRYLSLRVAGYDYDTHFGGVRYLFLRGINPRWGAEYGVFRDLPPAELIRELTECLIESQGERDPHDL